MKINNFLVVNVLVIYVFLANGQQNITNSTCKLTADSRCIHKCLRSGYVYGNSGNSTRYNGTLDEIVYRVFPSNETHINNDSFMANISIIPKKKHKGQRIFLNTNEVLGITLHDMSAILFSNGIAQLVPLDQYCVETKLVGDELNSTLVFGVNIEVFKTAADTKEAALYFPFLLLSCISFFASALFYLCVLNLDHRNNKKSIVGYTVNMGFSFLCLVLLQRIDNACKYLGVFFLLFTICAFVWFMFLCFDLVLDIRYFQNGYEVKTLWNIYLITSLAIPLLIVICSLISGTAGIPQTLIKSDDTICNFPSSNNAVFFAPVIITLSISLICICLAFYSINENNGKDIYKSEVRWLEKRSRFKYMCISCTLIWIILTIWIMEAGVKTTIGADFRNIALDLIEALQGIFAIVIFVSDRYTRRDLRNKFRRNSRTREEMEMNVNKYFGPTSINGSASLLSSNTLPDN